jgi:IS605 OrfB family transposase
LFLEPDVTITRSAKITYTVLEGADILAHGHETARKLWNYTRWCLIGYNEKLRIERGDSWEVYRRNLPHARGEKYPGGFGLQKELKDYWAAKELSDRCFSYTIKDFDIAMKSWFSNIKTNPQARPPKYSKGPRILNFEVGRNAKNIGEWTYKLTVLGGHIEKRHAVIKLHIQPGIKMRDIGLLRLQPDGTGVITFGKPTQDSPGDNIAGVDLGIINIAAIAFSNGDSILFTGKGILARNQWYQKRASQCKPKEWSKGKAESRQSERHKSYRRKAGNVQKLAVHNLTRHIINECILRSVGTIVMGDLTGIREDKDFGKRQNQQLHNWPFAEILRQIQYKAQEAGIEVITVSERNTSKCCHVCGQVGRRDPRGILTCQDCGFAINSDVNGAFNIMNKVSPVPAYAGVGVEAVLPGLPSPSAVTMGTGEAPLSQIEPTFIAKFDLRNWSVAQTVCNTKCSSLAIIVH